jgi:hypothetical protein
MRSDANDKLLRTFLIDLDLDHALYAISFFFFFCSPPL